MTIENKGISELTISGIASASSHVIFNETLPIKIPGMESRTIQLTFVAAALGLKTDTLFIQSDDPKTPILSVPCTANIVLPFAIVDNETAGSYFESGEWFKSVAQAYGSSSRYSYLNKIPKNAAIFKTILKHAGLYNVFEIVPNTVNASNKAHYILSVNGVPKDSIYLDQNYGSGNWVKLFNTELPKDVKIELKVSDTGLNTITNAVLRADAVKFSLVSEITSLTEKISSLIPEETKLEQNYPNPFNQSTRISFSLPKQSFVSLKIFDILGNEVATIVSGELSTGIHTREWNATNISSGIYFYRLQTGKFIEAKKLILMK